MDRYKIDLPGVNDVVNRFGLGPRGEIQKFFSNELMRVSDNYAPFDVGALKNSANIDIDGTAINYSVPYARVHWYGKVMAGSLPKQPTEADMRYQGAPMRGPKWVERAFADNKDAILKAVERMAKKL